MSHHVAEVNGCWFCGRILGHTANCPSHFGASPPALSPEPVTAPVRCTRCGVELCSHLDAYYGFDPLEASRCCKCRRGVS